MPLLFLALAAAAPHNPAAGSAERRAILDALRPSIEAQFRAPIEFLKPEMCVYDGWATVLADPRRKGGGAAPWRNAMTKEEHDFGGHQVSAVLRFRGGRWNLVQSELGATDVWYQDMIPRPMWTKC